MKKSILTLAVVLSFTYTFSANQFAPKKTNINNINDIVYIEEEEADEPFDFDYKAYLPEGFNAYDLTDNEADPTLWIDEDAEDEAFDFDHTQYLPVGFNPNKKFNDLFLEDIEWVDEDTDEPFAFDTKKYFNKSKSEILVTDNL
ncbi:MAG: hypothetical protein HQ471_09355 [Flavobacteriales bacterium]|jgi:hypothetical protein|nr:hypothetical protein [Flavobacteriales bacterium]